MEKRETILLELQEIAPTVAMVGMAMPYTLPAGYFENLPGTILSTLNHSSDEHFSKTNLLSAPPAGYFDQLAGEILKKIQVESASNPEEELADVAPMLNTVSKAMPYTVPENYFADFTVTTPGKVRSMPGRTIKKWFNLAAAAAIAGVLVTGVIKYTGFYNKTLDMERIEKEVAKSSDAEIIEYLDQHPTSTGYATNVSNTENATEAFEGDGLFDEMSDSELKEYLNDHSESVGKNVKDI